MPALDDDVQAPDSVDALRARIAATAGNLPKRLRQCADYVLANPEKIAVSTVAELAEAAGVQPSAFVRFCQAIGFSGFSEMQKLYRDAYAQRWPDYPTRLDRLRDRSGSPAHLLGDFVAAGHKSLSSLTENLNIAALDRSVALLAAASTIHVIGLRRSFAVASYLGYLLDKMEVPVLLHSALGGAVLENAVRSGDGLVAITFPPYSAETVALAKLAARQGVAVIGITDGDESPIAEASRELLGVTEVDVGAFRSLSATLALVAALAVAVGAAKSTG
jgi:DNA-binding MurR/RpiR family transcriptional regulator